MILPLAGAAAGAWYGWRQAARRLATGAPLRLDVVMAAHDQAAELPEALRSLQASDYPSDLRRVFVVADQCRDASALEAARHGAVVLVRRHGRGGRLGALIHGWRRLLSDDFADAFVLMRGPTVTRPDLLASIARDLAAGRPFTLAPSAGAVVVPRRIFDRSSAVRLAVAPSAPVLI